MKNATKKIGSVFGSVFGSLFGTLFGRLFGWLFGGLFVGTSFVDHFLDHFLARLFWTNNAETWLGMTIWSSGAAQGAHQLTNHIVASKLLSQMLPTLWILCSSCVFRPLHGRTPLWRRCGMACATTIFVNFFLKHICQKLGFRHLGTFFCEN